ncbi:MAG: His-Xaa-Ser system protein HxsD [Ruminococcus sp.]|nr:His-Xaa-Ser system protein HxsD [Ruminococcus sp.]MDY3844786.1 His-Xaa-Ser system protein HxsD [Ruminococcus sp.]
MRFTFSKEIYSKKTLLRASYTFTDEFYVHLSADEREYIVELSAKTGDNSIEYEEFNNEILSQALKEQLETDTKDIRTLIMARALSSSLIDNSEGTAEIENNDESADSIMKDWFEQNE